MKAHIFIQLKDGVLNPEAKAIENALKTLGFSSFDSLEVSKKITINLTHNDKNKALEDAKKMSEELLANLVIEDFNIQIEE
ncbi:phosphoribosylformylglycinamidine synthase subunit PurS [Helicobacter sp. faydin-H20]|uniref:phosphoribosylformylglycinamidine synthase subunit PurS n=1 Tax=Helicobacter anatolicus TaxID=2905874 RepID=UPI001E4FA536|nr:phosphoribosylformylglycinamidine synthase subunit PurS [Helicobacter anatolicus]MCE3036434.1 phosphoribosylformylglycinamidine synthase subunit PurS [Helicobacter anatolicus]MCE3037932.1 phosphoribosylformylglycinamidine synthase subunit PurS [Helicobacter anatolicus]